MEIRIVTGSMILGNDATPMLLIGDFKSAEGTLEVSDVSYEAHSTSNSCLPVSLGM